MESAARIEASSGVTLPYFLLRNTGMHPIRITSIIGGDGGKATQFRDNVGTCGVVSIGTYNISDYYYLAPGEEKYIAPSSSWWYGLPCRRIVQSFVGGTSSSYSVRGASSVCQNSSTSPGFLDYKTFGFEYIMYIEGQQITKRQIGKDLIIKCREPV